MDYLLKIFSTMHGKVLKYRCMFASPNSTKIKQPL